MNTKDLIIVGGEGGDLKIKKIYLDKYEFYAWSTNEMDEDMEFTINHQSPFYHSIDELLNEMKINIEMLYPDFVDQSVIPNLRKRFSNLPVENFENTGRNWNKFLGNFHQGFGYELLDVLKELYVDDLSAEQIASIFENIKLSFELKQEVEELLNEPMLFEGGGPGVRELMLLLVHQLKNKF